MTPTYSILITGCLSFLGGLLIPLTIGFMRRRAEALRGDADKKNDWQADLLDAIGDALADGNILKARSLHGELVKKIGGAP